MNYEQAKARQQELEAKYNACNKDLKAFDQHKNSIGLMPDNIKFSPEYGTAKEAYNRAFTEYRNFNGWFNKTFKKEVRTEKRVRDAQRNAKFDSNK